MTKLVLALLLLFSLPANIYNSALPPKEPVEKIIHRNISEFVKLNSYIGTYQNRVIECILKFSMRYGHDPKLIDSIIRVESGYRFWVISNKDSKHKRKKAYGIMQVKPYFHGYVLYYIDDRRLGKILLKKENPDHDKYFLRVGYNIESGCYILRNLVNKYNSYDLALVAYNHGENSGIFRKCLRGEINPSKVKYVKKVYEGL